MRVGKTSEESKRGRRHLERGGVCEVGDWGKCIAAALQTWKTKT